MYECQAVCTYIYHEYLDTYIQYILAKNIHIYPIGREAPVILF